MNLFVIFILFKVFQLRKERDEIRQWYCWICEKKVGKRREMMRLKGEERKMKIQKYHCHNCYCSFAYLWPTAHDWKWRREKILYCGNGITKITKRREKKIVLWQWVCQIGEKREIKKLYCGNRVAEIGEMRGKKF